VKNKQIKTVLSNLLIAPPTHKDLKTVGKKTKHTFLGRGSSLVILNPRKKGQRRGSTDVLPVKVVTRNTGFPN